jgi:hypothetical protein
MLPTFKVITSPRFKSRPLLSRAALLACDADLDRVARVIGIELDHSAGPDRP